MNQGMRIAAAAWLCASAGWAADWKTLKPQGYVSDYAGAVDSASRAELDVYCAALEKATGAHLSMAVVESLEKEPVDAVARAIFHGWAEGSNSPDDRALLLISVGNRRDSLVAGRALESVLTPDAMEAVLADARPALARRQYGQALMAAADEIGNRIAVARHRTLSVHLPQRARRTLADSIPWPLVAGAIPLVGLLIWLLRRPHHRQPPQPPQETA
jgi:uncharacterized protein